MDTKERHVRENEEHRHDDATSDVIADGIKAKGKNQKRESTRRINKLWLWLGVLILVIILLWWLYVLVTGYDLAGGQNSMLLRAVDTLKMIC